MDFNIFSSWIYNSKTDLNKKLASRNKKHRGDSSKYEPYNI